MDKLLHERLREHKNGNFYIAGYPIYLTRSESDYLADEIERFYIPRPRFEDGEPVEFGSKDIDWGNHKDLGLTFNALGRSGKPIDIGLIGCEPHFAELTDDGFVKRLTPKALDADGVPFKAEKTIYNVHTGVAVTLVGIARNGLVAWRNSGGGTGTWEPEKCTHERPVFDANGERICKGDTVWSKYGNKYTVEKVAHEPEVTDFGVVYLTNSEQMRGCDVSHREPDSLEKLRDDIKAESNNLTFTPYQGTRDRLNGYADRLTALIERGA